MIELYSELYIGSDADVDVFLDQHPDGCIMHAAKEPWHRNALGYTGRAAPKDHKHYLYMLKDTRMYLNLVDSPDAKYIPEKVVDVAVRQALEWYWRGCPILIHCNKGESRSVLIGHCLKPWLGEPLQDLLSPKGQGCYEYGAEHLSRYRDLANVGELP